MNKIFAASTAITFAAGLFITHRVSKKAGKVEGINTLRKEQLAQALAEYSTKRLVVKYQPDIAACKEVDKWYEEETASINEMYDDIVNKL